MEKKEEVVEKIVVVPELPTQQVSKVLDEATGKPMNLITIAQALTEIYEDVKEIKRKVA